MLANRKTYEKESACVS